MNNEQTIIKRGISQVAMFGLCSVVEVKVVKTGIILQHRSFSLGEGEEDEAG